MKASTRQQQLILELQQLDTALVRLQRRRTQLPERQELAGLAEETRAVRDRFMSAQRLLEDLQTEIERVESDVELVRQRQKRTSGRLAISVSSKEAQALQEELDSLDARKSLLEERELELMEKAETAENEFSSASAVVAGIDSRRADLDQKISEAEAEIDVEMERVSEERAGLAAEIQVDLREVYERTRERYGIGAARLIGNVSEGSNMELDAADLAAIRSADPETIFFCPVSGAILVRENATPTSGQTA